MPKTDLCRMVSPHLPHISLCPLLAAIQLTALCDMRAGPWFPLSCCTFTDRWSLLVSVQIEVFNNVDSYPSRRFNLEWPTYQIKVGRGSQSGEKELFPASNNAWFESRVMSRQHAILQADPVTKVQLKFPTSSLADHADGSLERLP
jgi:hypothetical protein